VTAVPAALHSSESNEHYTPSWIVEGARRVLGAIDFDPFSCAAANERVKATRYLSAGGFTAEWGTVGKPSRVLLNPPGGLLDAETLEPTTRDDKTGSGKLSAPCVAWSILHSEISVGRVLAAVVVVFNLDFFSAVQGKKYGERAPYSYPFVVPRSRVSYFSPAAGKEKSGAPGASAIVLVDAFDAPESADARAAFAEYFSAYGEVRL
jgi:hypothetical protein